MLLEKNDRVMPYIIYILGAINFILIDRTMIICPHQLVIVKYSDMNYELSISLKDYVIKRIFFKKLFYKAICRSSIDKN